MLRLIYACNNIAYLSLCSTIFFYSWNFQRIHAKIQIRNHVKEKEGVFHEVKKITSDFMRIRRSFPQMQYFWSNFTDFFWSYQSRKLTTTFGFVISALFSLEKSIFSMFHLDKLSSKSNQIVIPSRTITAGNNLLRLVIQFGFYRSNNKFYA